MQTCDRAVPPLLRNHTLYLGHILLLLLLLLVPETGSPAVVKKGAKSVAWSGKDCNVSTQTSAHECAHAHTA